MRLQTQAVDIARDDIAGDDILGLDLRIMQLDGIGIHAQTEERTERYVHDKLAHKHHRIDIVTHINVADHQRQGESECYPVDTHIHPQGPGSCGRGLILGKSLYRRQVDEHHGNDHQQQRREHYAE